MHVARIDIMTMTTTTTVQQPPDHSSSPPSSSFSSPSLAAVSDAAGIKLSLYDGELLLVEGPETFADVYTLNFHLQTLAKKHGIERCLMVVCDREKGSVELLLAKDEGSFFIPVN